MREKNLVSVGFIIASLISSICFYLYFTSNDVENLSTFNETITKYACHSLSGSKVVHNITLVEGNEYHYITTNEPCNIRLFNYLIDNHIKVSFIVDNINIYQLKISKRIVLGYDDVNEILQTHARSTLFLGLLFLSLAGFLRFKQNKIQKNM